MLKIRLIQLADRLDDTGLRKEADLVDNFITSIAGTDSEEIQKQLFESDLEILNQLKIQLKNVKETHLKDQLKDWVTKTQTRLQDEAKSLGMPSPGSAVN